ncbi:Hypothetical protein PHPALM_8688 [Phytophthora palmivora]|uniref:Uncharacterized protein n=1 Tax=Phytophthora palmivora TaxID=4796 RepID=A0A2P4Y982_9STRA|nr:Hypothetical protein PHPALM_8688 [Phytophthora palmivora]
MWMDSHPVHMISFGFSDQNEKQNSPAPGLVRDYQRWMGGKDIYDQLLGQHGGSKRLHHPSSLHENQQPEGHCKFIEVLHVQLLAIDDDRLQAIEEETHAEDRTAASIATTCSREPPTEQGERYTAWCPDYVGSTNGRKRVARLCKVCATYNVKP